MRRALLALPLLIALPRPTLAQQHWLVGRWVGHAVGASGNSRRTLIVTAVAADGSATGSWGNLPARITVSGESVEVINEAGRPTILRRTGPNSLAGDNQAGQRSSYPITLERQ